MLLFNAWTASLVAWGAFAAHIITTPAEVDVADPELAVPPRPSAAKDAEIRSELNNKCLEILDSNTANGAQVGVWDCHGGANQRWYFDGFQIRSVMNNKCLEILNTDTSNGARVAVWDCHGGANQRWYWDNGQVRSKLHNKCLEILNTDTANGAWVGVWDCHGGANQRWYLE